MCGRYFAVSLALTTGWLIEHRVSSAQAANVQRVSTGDEFAPEGRRPQSDKLCQRGGLLGTEQINMTKALPRA